MMTEEEKRQRKSERDAAKALKREERKQKILEDTAKFMYNVFNKDSGNYSKEFEKLLLSGGGGNSMFVNCWAKPSGAFVKSRISGKAKEELAKYGYVSLWDSPHEFRYHNAKGAENRLKHGKHLHLDHNPGNVKVLSLIRERCRSYNSKEQSYEEIIIDLKKYLMTIQTLDWITVEQDDVRTLSDSNYKKKIKDMMTHEERDALLNDTWEYL